MEFHELKELHYITPIANVVSICQHGILSHKRAKSVPHQSVAMEEIQQRRSNKKIPDGRLLHEYVNLYICARNPMLYKRQAQHAQLCVLSVSTAVLHLAGVVVTDQNAASKWCRFAPAPHGLANVDKNLVFADYWTHADQIEEWRHKSIKCAEVLVPDRVDPKFINAAYVSCEESASLLSSQLNAAQITLAITVNKKLFFR